MIKKLWFALILIIAVFSVNILSAQELHEYFYSLSKDMSTPDVKITFLNKAIDANPNFKQAYDDLIEIYEKADDKENADMVREKYKKNATLKPKSEQTVETPKIDDQPKKNIIPKTEPKIIQSSAEPEKIQQPVEISKPKVDDTDYEKPVIQTRPEPAPVEETEETSFNKKWIYYAAAAVVIGVAAYFTYKYFFKDKKSDSTLDTKESEKSSSIPAQVVAPIAIEPAKKTEPAKSESEEEYTYIEPENLKTAPAALPELPPLPPIEQQQYTAAPGDNANVPMPPLPDMSAQTMDEPPVMQDFNQPSSPARTGMLYNLNNVTFEQLSGIQGCDEITAHLIVSYRNYLIRTGQSSIGYTSINQLDEIPLIKKEILNMVKQYLTLQ